MILWGGGGEGGVVLTSLVFEKIGGGTNLERKYFDGWGFHQLIPTGNDKELK